jgi:hypothetical protein
VIVRHEEGLARYVVLSLNLLIDRSGDRGDHQARRGAGTGHSFVPNLLIDCSGDRGDHQA